MSETSTANRQEKVVVVGGGISGLASAYFLSKNGFRPTLIEKTDRLGGLIQTQLMDGCELEAGPDSFIAAKPAVAELAAELGITDQIIGSNDERRRVFIQRRGKLVPFPAGMAMMVPGDLGAVLRSELFNTRTKAGFFREVLSLPRTRTADVSIQDFVRDHFSDEMLAYVTEPLLSGVYGGDSGRLSAASVLPRFLEYERKYGSLIRGVRRERTKPAQHKGSLFLSFHGGMQTLVDALVREISGRVEIRKGEAETVEKTATGWNVWAGEQSVSADHVVLACPAHVNSRLLKAAAPELAETLAEIPYRSAILVMLVYDRDELGHTLDGFGFLVPRCERKSVAAATWVSTKFPARTPKSRAALRAFIVGEEAARLMNTSDSELVAVAREEFQRVMGIGAAPLFSTVHRWPDSMPQYVVGHEKWNNTVVQQVSRYSGLHFCGNAYDGVGIPDCVRLARETAKRIVLDSPPR
ncbi:MAG: protoporphyrinogen oxidase [Acidobacteriota bacterium]|nr:protoporphyrinogen oxidase [Acidobacteriota bacterium]